MPIARSYTLSAHTPGQESCDPADSTATHTLLFFIAAYFKTVYTNSPTTIIGSEAMIVVMGSGTWV